MRARGREGGRKEGWEGERECDGESERDRTGMGTPPFLSSDNEAGRLLRVAR